MKSHFSRGLLLASLLAGLIGVAPARAHTSFAPGVPIAGTTTVTFTGNRGITLLGRSEVATPVAQMELTVLSGTYATVHVIPRSDEHVCAKATPGVTHCLNMFIVAARPPGHPEMRFLDGPDAWVNWGSPETIDRGATDFYLFTDGTARLVIRAPKLSGARRYTATGRINGGTRLMPVHCALAAPACTSSTGYGNGTLRGGGLSFDFQEPTYLQSLTTTFVIKPTAAAAAHSSLAGGARPCLYGVPAGRQAPKPSDYPFGCELGSTNSPERSTYDAEDFVGTSSAGWQEYASYAFYPEFTAGGYAGFSDWIANPGGEVWSVGIASWHTYGIH